MKYKILKGQLGLKVLSEKSDNTQVNNIRRPVQKIKYNYVPMSYSNRMKLQAQKYKDDNSLFSGSRLLDRTKELGKVIKTPAATLAASATAVASPTIAARLLTGATSAVGFGQLGMGSGNSVKDAVYGMAGEAAAPLVGKILDKGIGIIKSAGKKLTDIKSANPLFKSEINWGNWNQEIPANKSLMDEYHNIEMTTKTNGTWMKNPDGSEFKGLPEQFIQQRSINFKKAYPEGFSDVYRGVNENKPEFLSNKSIFTATKDVADTYAFGPKRIIKNELSLPDIDGGTYNLYVKNSKNAMDIEASGSDWNNLNLRGFESPNRSLELTLKEKQKYVKNPINSFDYYSARKSIKGLRALRGNLSPVASNNPEMFNKMADALSGRTTTNRIAEYIEGNNLDYVKLKNIRDGGYGDVTIVNNKPGNYLKSAIGNNGMFDMTNPNIYKTITGISAGLGALKLNKQ